MTRLWRLAGVMTLGFFACEGPVDPARHGTGGLALTVHPAPAGSAALESAYVRVRGPTDKTPIDRTVKVYPVPVSAVATISDLELGFYSVAVEGFAGGAVDRFFQVNNVKVNEGPPTRVDVTGVQFASFVPSQVTIPDDAVGKTFTVGFQSVPGAMGYVAQASIDQSFATVKDSARAPATQTSVSVTVSDYGTYYVRVRAIDPNGLPGRWATAVSNIVVMSPPDLIVESLTHTPANPTTANTITFAAVVKTTGIVKIETIEPMIANKAAFNAALESLHVMPLNAAVA